MQCGTYSVHRTRCRLMEYGLGMSLLIYLRVADFITLSESQNT